MALTPEERQAFLDTLTDTQKARFNALPPQKQSWLNALTPEQLNAFAQTPKMQDQLLNRLFASSSMGELREGAEYAIKIAPAHAAEAQSQIESNAAIAKKSEALHAQAVAEQTVKHREYVQGIIDTAGSQIGTVMSAAKTVNPEMVTTGSMWGYNYNTTREDLVKIDQALADNPTARVAFHSMIGNGVQIRTEGTNTIIFPETMTSQNVAAFNKVLENTNGTETAFAKASPMGPAQEPCEPKAIPAAATRDTNVLTQYASGVTNRTREAEEKAMGMQNASEGDLGGLAPAACPGGPGGARQR